MPLLELAVTYRFAMWGSLPNVGISDKSARANLQPGSYIGSEDEGVNSLLAAQASFYQCLTEVILPTSQSGVQCGVTDGGCSSPFVKVAMLAVSASSQESFTRSFRVACD